MRRFTNWYLSLNIYSKLSPFLLLCMFLCLVFAPNKIAGDEERYLCFVNNLYNGYYTLFYPDFILLGGPDYPLFLAPFIILKLPLYVLRLLNGLFLYFSLVINYKIISEFSSKRNTFSYTVLLGLCFLIYQMLPLILTESFTWFLISLVCYLFIISYMRNKISWKLIFLTPLSG